MASHPILRRINAEGHEKLAVMKKNRVLPGAQAASIREQGHPLAQRQDIYNTNIRNRRKMLAGRTSIQALLDELTEKKYTMKITELHIILLLERS